MIAERERLLSLVDPGGVSDFVEGGLRMSLQLLVEDPRAGSGSASTRDHVTAAVAAIRVQHEQTSHAAHPAAPRRGDRVGDQARSAAGGAGKPLRKP
ncbi:MAG: hypothetical protein ABI047_09415, partial [Jatrophihabitantaceae bacterium]